MLSFTFLGFQSGLGVAGQSQGGQGGAEGASQWGSSAHFWGVWRAQVLSRQGLPRTGQSGPRAWGILCAGGWGGGLRAEVAAYSAAGVTESGEWLGLSHQRWDLGRRNANPCLLLGSAPCLARSRGSHPGLVLLSFSGAWLCVVCGEQSHRTPQNP